MSRNVWMLFALVVLCVAMFAYARTRPLISDDDLSDAGVEIARGRAFLHELECVRPAVFGEASEPAMPLRDFLRLDGPLADCWDAPAHCSALPEELARQAATPSRCAPTLSADEVGAHDDPFLLTDRHPIVRRVILLTNHGVMSNDDRFRLLVQGMAIGRDLTQGRSSFEQAQWGARIETEIGSEFAAQFGTRSPSAKGRIELDHALGALAEMHVDANAILSGDALRSAEMFQTFAIAGRHMYTDEDLRWRVYASAMVVRDLQKWCPPGGSVEGCISRLPTTPPPLPSQLRLEALGDWASRYQLIDYATFSMVRSYPDELRALEALRDNARALQELVRWSGERADGRCPEISSWEPKESGERLYVQRRGEHLYELVTPGEQKTFLFRCPVRPAP